ncbi:MAG: protein kinase [Bryobacterales bacterium]|nr:protein kinase [Bryobacterales bacterium]
MQRLFVFVALLAGLPVEAVPNRFHVYPNAQISVLSIAGDDQGTLWLGAADGLYRFDGARFRKLTDFPLRRVTHVAVDGDGQLWAGGPDGLVRHGVRTEILGRERVTSLSARPFVLVATAEGAWRPAPSGDLRRVHGGTEKSFLVRGNQAWFVCGTRACWLDFSNWNPDSPEVPLHRDMEVGADAEQVVMDADGMLYVATDRGVRYFLDHNYMGESVLRSTHAAERPSLLTMGRGGRPWLLGDSMEAPIKRSEFHRPLRDHRFPAVAAWEDQRGHLWVAYQGEGIVEWIPDRGWERWFREQHFGSDTAQVVRGTSGQLVAVTHDQLFRFDLNHRVFARLPAESLRYDSLQPLTGGGWLAATRPDGLTRLDADGRVLERVGNHHGAQAFFRTMAADGDGKIWVGNRYYLGLVTGTPGRLSVTRGDLAWPKEESELVNPDLQLDPRKRLWLGYAGGLAVLDNERWQAVRTDRPLRSVRSLAVGEDEIWVAYRSPGRFSRLRRAGEVWRVSDFAATQGYTPFDTRFVRRDSRGWIWRGTAEGVLISNGRDTAPDDWLHLHSSNGTGLMGLGQYGFFEDRDGSVWLAGAEGVAHLNPEPAWFEAPKEAPALSGFTVTEDGAHAEVSTLLASPFRPKPLRYRLLPVMKEWRLSADGALSFSKLAVGEYTLEVAHTGSGEPAVLRRTFTVTGTASGVWRWWLLLAGMLAGAGGLALRRSEWARYWVAKWRYRLRWRMGMERASYEMAPGEVLRGHYRVVGLLSEGGFSLVYEAEDTRQKGQRLALKVALPVAGEPDWVRERFAFEVATLQSIRHPGVVAVLDSWMDERGWPCLVMPLLEGPTLREALGRGPLAVGRAARLIRQLGAALGEIHGRGVVHRDVKPDNVILTGGEGGEQAVLIDFGAAAFQAGNGGLATTRLVAASVRYTAPERLTGHYSPASDVYSLAVTVLEMVSGRPAVELGAVAGSTEFAEAIAGALRAELGEQVSVRVAGLLAKGFALEAGQRPGEVGAWCEAIAAEVSRADRGAT